MMINNFKFFSIQLFLLLLYCFTEAKDDCDSLLAEHNDIDCFRKNSDSACWLNGTMGGYLNNTEIEQRFARLHCLYPSLFSEKIPIGKTVENRSIYAYELGHAKHTGANLLAATMVHARDVTSLVTLVYSIEQLCRSYIGGTDKELIATLDNLSVTFVPVVNVDAFERDTEAHPHGGGESIRNVGSYRDPRVKDPKCFGVNLDHNL